MWILAGLLGRRQRILVSPQTVREERRRPQRKREPHPLAVPEELPGPRLDGSLELVPATAERCDREDPVRRDDLTLRRLGEPVRLFEE